MTQRPKRQRRQETPVPEVGRKVDGALAKPQRVLVKLRDVNALAAADARANLRPLFDAPVGTAAALGLSGEPRWFVADLPDGAATPWDLAHARIAAQLGVDESAVVFAEPDLVHTIFQDETGDAAPAPFAVGDKCDPLPQNGANGQAVGPHDGWHLDDEFSQLASARSAVAFSARTSLRSQGNEVLGGTDCGRRTPPSTAPTHPFPRWGLPLAESGYTAIPSAGQWRCGLSSWRGIYRPRAEGYS